MDTEKAEQLLRKYENDELDAKELAVLESWYLKYLDMQPGLTDERILLQKLEDMDRAFSSRRIKPSIYKRYIAAASILLLAVAVFFAIHYSSASKLQYVQSIKNDVLPGRQQATLTLSNGKRILLKKGLSGAIARQEEIVVRASDQQLSYMAEGKSNSAASYNTLSTARGERLPYPLVLSDGTKIWLNAESSITFPVAFNTTERRVRITGEAYFEVCHKTGSPFIVESDGQLTEDIGTSFNINSYKDEPFKKTTLVEGAVSVNGKQLQPGQQSLLKGSQVEIKEANLQQAIAWKEGNFRFDGEKIDAIMRQLQRWYDVEVIYEGKVPQELFYARVSQYKTIKQVLDDLAYTQGVQFKIEGRRIRIIR